MNMNTYWISLVKIKNEDNVRDSFMESFMDFASFGGIIYNRKDSVYKDGGTSFDKLVWGMAPYFNYINKVIVLHPSKNIGISRLMWMLRFLSELAVTAPFSADIYYATEQKEAAKYLSSAHVMAKKSSVVFPLREFNNIEAEARRGRIPGVISVDDEDSAIRVALGLVALSSGIHRHGLALRQVAAQELMEAVLEGKVGLVGLLAAIYVDAYLWYTYEAARKAPVAGEELLYSVLSGDLLEIGRKLLEKFRGEEIACMYRAAVASLTEKLESVARKVGGSGDVLERVERFTREVWGVARKVLRDVTGNVVGGRRDAVLGRVGMVAGELKGKLGEASCMVVPLTEQTSPAFVGMLWRALGGPGCVRVVYTPQTLYNRLLFEYFSPFGGRGGSVDVEFIPVMGLEPRVTYEVIRGLAGELEEKGFRGKEEVFVLGQGNMAVFLSLLSLVETLDASFKGL